MNITLTKVKRRLEKDYGWNNMNFDGDNQWFVDNLIKDTLKVVDDELKLHKGISIKNK